MATNPTFSEQARHVAVKLTAADPCMLVLPQAGGKLLTSLRYWADTAGGATVMLHYRASGDPAPTPGVTVAFSSEAVAAGTAEQGAVHSTKLPKVYASTSSPYSIVGDGVGLYVEASGLVAPDYVVFSAEYLER